MTTINTPTARWAEATKPIADSVYADAYDRALAEINAKRAKLKNPNPTETQFKQARGLAKAEVIKALHQMESFAGVDNPTFNDPEWGHGTRAERQAATVAAKPIKANKYGGKCPKCDGWVEAEAGKLIKTDGKWGAEHITCPAPEAATDNAMVSLKPTSGIDLAELPSGYYAVPQGDTRLKLRVAQGKPNSKWDGYTFVTDGAEYGQQQRYGTQRPGQLYTGQVQDELTAILADPKEAMAAYGKLTGTCGKCGRALEDEESVARGIGPICAKGW